MSIPRERDPEQMIAFIMGMIREEGCIVIRPHREPFRVVERDFLDGLRRIPASISCPPGKNPYSYALGQPGQWLITWIPDK